MAVTIRAAALPDAPGIHRLLDTYAREHLLLARSLGAVYENLRDFRVAVDGALLGCTALHLVNERLAEVKSLAVAPAAHGRGIGRALVENACDEAAAWGLERVFCLTYQVDFFARLGWVRVDRSRLPEKIWSECVRCDRFLDCDETAMWKLLAPTAP